MCVEPDSAPPIPVIAGADVRHCDLVLESSDGNRFAAFAAAHAETQRVGIVVLPDRRGLFSFYEQVALRFAERGYSAVAMDYFGRTAGVERRPEDFDFAPHVERTSADQIQIDIAAAVAYLRSDKGGGCASVFTVGFCFGGRQSWLAGSSGHGVAGAVGLYGHPGQHPLVPGRGPTLRAAETTAPILALQAGDDANIPGELNVAFDEALTAAGVEHEVVTYDGAPHSFFDRHHEQFAEASADAWERTLSFVEHHAHVATRREK